jgi:tetratricopeptide (TPR) repeat protein
VSQGFRALTVLLACAATAGVVCLSRLGHEAPRHSREIVTLLETGHYDEAEIAARSHLSALRRSHADGSLPVAYASDVLVRALRLNGKASQPETLQLAERTVRAKRMHLGDVHAETAISLLNLGQVLGDRGDMDRAISELQRSLKIREQLESNDLDLAEVLDAIGNVFTIARSYDAALAVLNRSRQAKARALPPNHPSLRITLETAAVSLQGKGDYAAARERLDLAAATGEAIAGHPSRVTSLNVLAQQLWFEGDPRRSRDVSLGALRLARQRLRPDHPEIARTLQILAATIDDLGDMDASLRYRQEALAVAQRSLGDTHYELAGYLNDLGDLNLTLGAYAEARAQFDQALRIATARLPAEHDWIPMIVHNFALVDARLGDFEGARRQHARAIDMWERALGPNHSYIALALTELATVLREQGAAAEALPLLERALAIREGALGPHHRDTAFTLIDIAATLSQMGQNDRAQEFASRALVLWERIDTSEGPGLATVLKLYAELQFSRGAFDDARRYFERSLAIRRKAFGPSHPDVAGVQAALALTHARLGHESEAFETALQAETSGRDHLRLISRYLPERQALSYAVNRPRALDLILSLARTESASVVLDAVIRSRALVLDEMATRRHGVTAAVDALAPLQAQLSSAEQRLANLLVRGPTQQTSNQYLSLVDAARQDKEDAERALAARSASFREQRNQAQSGLRELRASLPADTAMVSFVRFSRSSLLAGGTSSSSPTPGTPAYVAFVPHSRSTT